MFDPEARLGGPILRSFAYLHSRPCPCHMLLEEALHFINNASNMVHNPSYCACILKVDPGHPHKIHRLFGASGFEDFYPAQRHFITFCPAKRLRNSG